MTLQEFDLKQLTMESSIAAGEFDCNLLEIESTSISVASYFSFQKLLF